MSGRVGELYPPTALLLAPTVLEDIRDCKYFEETLKAITECKGEKYVSGPERGTGQKAGHGLNRVANKHIKKFGWSNMEYRILIYPVPAFLKIMLNKNVNCIAVEKVGNLP